ncbi:MAG TPA: Crp/Fnr family transcriptional regulator, partial [Erythrobacter sp.]|nr:Crp/Fnr family transcriptional regulator [Erythrobacter sp.]
MPELSLSRPTSFCDACAIRNRAICADLDDREIGLLNSIGRRRH